MSKLLIFLDEMGGSFESTLSASFHLCTQPWYHDFSNETIRMTIQWFSNNNRIKKMIITTSTHCTSEQYVVHSYSHVCTTIHVRRCAFKVYSRSLHLFISVFYLCVARPYFVQWPWWCLTMLWSLRSCSFPLGSRMQKCWPKRLCQRSSSRQSSSAHR